MPMQGILQQWDGQRLRGVRTPSGASHHHEEQAGMAVFEDEIALLQCMT